MTDTDDFFDTEYLRAALTEYENATLSTGHHIERLLNITVSPSGSAARTLPELRGQVALRLRHRDGEVGVITAPGFDFDDDVFDDPQPASARFALRTAIRLTHNLGFSAEAEIAVGQMAVAALRETADLSHLAYRIAEADHIESIRAAFTLGRPVRVQRDFVVRYAVFGLGEALNAEHDPDDSASAAVETWLNLQHAFRRHRR